jgi:dihydrofolate synthase/folylpolyglutamate synthase
MKLPEPVDLTDLLEPFRNRGVDLGLERLQRGLAAMGHPERRFEAVQVAGTNGKGSIVAMLEAILRAAGVPAGVYRSPHLRSWCERICLDGAWIDPDQLRMALQAWEPQARAQQLTTFEQLTGAAFSHFAAAAVPLAVLEVGLGGRLDATTTHPQRTVLGLATIGLDHCEWLGDTLGAIAGEKAGVFSPGAVAISGPQAPEVRQVFERQAAASGTELRWVEPLADTVPLGLPGDLQRLNGAVAVGMAQALAERGWPLPAEAIARGLAAARWPGRLERRAWRGQPLLLDGAHNPPAAQALRRELDRLAPGGGRRWLIGIQRHKDGPAMLVSLLAPGDQAWIVAFDDHDCWTAAALGQAAPALAAQLHQAVDGPQGLDQLLGPGPLPVVTGSLHLLGSLWGQLEALDT